MGNNYIKHGTGPNDHKKGNRTRGKDRRGGGKGPGKDSNTAGLVARCNEVHAMSEHYKEIARSRAHLLRYDQTFAAGMADRMQAYIEDCRENGVALSMAGMIEASGMEQSRFYMAMNGDYDHLLYQFMDAHDLDFDLYEGTRVTLEDGTEALLVRLSELLKTAKLAVQRQREEQAMDTKARQVAGPIFLLKSAHGFKEDGEPKTINNTLIVAPEEQIRAALDKLG